MELRGERTALGDYNREVKQTNRQLEQIDQAKAVEPEKFVRVYVMGREAAARKVQTWQEKMEDLEQYGGVSQKRARVEALTKEFDARLESEPTVLMREAFDPIAKAEAKLDDAKRELAAAMVKLDEAKRDPQAVVEVKAEIRKEVRRIEAAREGTRLLRPDYELAKVDLEIKRIKELQRLEQAQEARAIPFDEQVREFRIERPKGQMLEKEHQRDKGPKKGRGRER
jgi:hypothetical protein